MSRRIQRSKRGFTIIEMLVCVAMLSILLPLLAISLVTLLEVGQSSAERLAWQSTWHRLTLDFRSDAHGAREAQLLGDAAAVLQFTGVDRTVAAYEADTNGVHRTAKRDDVVVGSEFYRLPPATRATLALTQGPQGEMAAISLAGEPGDHRSSTATTALTIDAYIGLDQRRFAAPEATP